MGPAPSGAYRSSKGQTAKVAKKVHRGPKPGVGNQGKKRKHLPPVDDKPTEEGQDGDDGEDVGDNEDQAVVDTPAPKKRQKKQFVESQDALLAMVASISSEQEAKKKQKVKAVKKPKSTPIDVKPESKKKQQLEAAKAAVVSQRSKAKQERKDEDAVVEAVLSSKGSAPSADAKKRVSFA